jgi:hypothetical protein
MSQSSRVPQFEIPRTKEGGFDMLPGDSLPTPVLQEKMLSQPEQNTPGQHATSQMPMIPVGQSQVGDITGMQSGQAMTMTPAPITTTSKAEDIDVIEKEWVEKAKKVLKSSGDDPHQSVKQISLLKAEYMRKRFNRELKLPEELGVQR